MKSLETLLMHVAGPDPLDGPRFVTVDIGHGKWGVAMVLDGWYTTRVSAEDTVEFWQQALNDVLQPAES